MSTTHALPYWALVATIAAACTETNSTTSAPSVSLGGSSDTLGSEIGGHTVSVSAYGGTANSAGGKSQSLGSSSTGGSPALGGDGHGTGGGTMAPGGGTGGKVANSAGASSTSVTTAGGSTGGVATTRGSTRLTGGRGDSGGDSAGGGSAAGGSATGGSATGGTMTGGVNATGATTGGNAARTSGGTASQGGGAGSSAAGGSGSFVLAWEDDFNALDPSAWQLMTHSWDGNLAQFSANNVSVASGVLSIQLTTAANDTAKPYRGVEMRSIKTLTRGKVSARIRFAKGSGVISALVTIYTPWPADNWNEIDIEHLGKTPTSSQLNCMVYTGAPVTPPVTQSVSPTQDPLIVSPGFDAETAFHQYDIEWTDTAVRTLMDGVLMRTWTKEVSRMTLPQNILFTIWASSSADWAGALTSNSAPTSADIDWIRVYDWKP